MLLHISSKERSANKNHLFQMLFWIFFHEKMLWFWYSQKFMPTKSLSFAFTLFMDAKILLERGFIQSSAQGEYTKNVTIYDYEPKSMTISTSSIPLQREREAFYSSNSATA